MKLIFCLSTITIVVELLSFLKHVVSHISGFHLRTQLFVACAQQGWNTWWYLCHILDFLKQNIFQLFFSSEWFILFPHSVKYIPGKMGGGIWTSLWVQKPVGLHGWVCEREREERAVPTQGPGRRVKYPLRYPVVQVSHFFHPDAAAQTFFTFLSHRWTRPDSNRFLDRRRTKLESDFLRSYIVGWIASVKIGPQRITVYGLFKKGCPGGEGGPTWNLLIFVYFLSQLQRPPPPQSMGLIWIFISFFSHQALMRRLLVERIPFSLFPSNKRSYLNLVLHPNSFLVSKLCSPNLVFTVVLILYQILVSEWMKQKLV